MTSKTLSTGTLSLRFMQNAQRAKQPVPVVDSEAEQARVKDDGEWEVAREVREAWDNGVSSNGSSPIRQSVTYESSYLPFIFPSTSNADEDFPSSSMKRGRRSFNKKGEEIDENVDPETPTTPAPASTPTQPDKATKSNDSSQRPTSISLGAGAGRSSKALKDPTRTARAVIHDAGEVGTDLRPARGVFLRPAGVDAPAEKTGRVDEGEEEINSEREVKKEEVSTGARNKSRGARVKRGREGEAGGSANINGEGEGKRRKKKKQLVE